MKSAVVSGGSSYRYYRIYQVGGGGNWAFGAKEIEIFAAATAPAFLTSNGTDLTNGLGASGFVSDAVNGTAANLFDNSSSTEWYSGGTANVFAGIDLGTAQEAHSANIALGDVFLNSTDIVFQGSNDGTNYTTLATISNPVDQTVYSLAW